MSFRGQWNQAPETAMINSDYGTGMYGSNPAAGGWATGNSGVDKYISTLDSALKNGRVGGAQKMKEDLEWAQRMAGGGAGATGNVDINNLPNFGGSAGAGSATLRANPYEARLSALLDNPDSIANTAGYKFEMDQGQQALARSAAAKGMTGSGNTLAALLERGQGLAATRRGQEVDRLSSLVQGRDSMNANLYGTDVGANTSRYATDVGSKTSMWNTGQKINADNYWNALQATKGGSSGGWSPTTGSTVGSSFRGGAVSRFAPQQSAQQDAWDMQWANRPGRF